MNMYRKFEFGYGDTQDTYINVTVSLPEQSIAIMTSTCIKIISLADMVKLSTSSQEEIIEYMADLELPIDTLDVILFDLAQFMAVGLAAMDYRFRKQLKG